MARHCLVGKTFRCIQIGWLDIYLQEPTDIKTCLESADNVEVFVESADNVEVFVESADNVEVFVESADNVEVFVESADNVEVWFPVPSVVLVAGLMADISWSNELQCNLM